MRLIRAIRVLVLICALAFPDVTFAGLTRAQLDAASGGRLVGGAKACGWDSDLLTLLSKFVLMVAQEHAANEEDDKSLEAAFNAGYKYGLDEVTAGHRSCAQVEDAMRSLETYPRNGSRRVP